MPEGKWVSKENLQTFWQSIRSNLSSLVTNEVNNILPPIIQEDVIDAYIPDILGNFAEVEDAPTATKNYAIGDYLVLNKHFYKATAAITSGDTLVEGTNIERTNVGAEVSEILNLITVGSITVNSSYISNVYSNVVYKIGNAVFYMLLAQAKTEIPSNATFGTLPFKTASRSDSMIMSVSNRTIISACYIAANTDQMKANGASISSSATILVQGFYIAK